MKRNFGIIISAGPKDDLAGRKSEFEKLKTRHHEEMSRKVEDYLAKSRKLGEIDKSEGNVLDNTLLSLLNEIRSLANAAKQMTSISEVEDDANRLPIITTASP